MIAEPRVHHLEIRLQKEKFWYFTLISQSNGQVLMVSETYYSKWNAKRAAKKLAKINGFLYREIV